MLDIIRKKASAWGTKVIFGVIIIVFVFFFGYNQMTRQGRENNVVARVGSHAITRPEFNLVYENTLKMYQNIFKDNEGGMPKDMEKSVQQSAVNQLIQQTIVRSIADQLDVGPSKSELVALIRTLPVAQDESGQFNPIVYKQRWLPYFKQKYGLDYEDLINSDLAIEHVNGVFSLNGDEPAPRSLFDLEKTKYTFLVTEYSDEASAKADKDGKAVKVPPVTVATRGALFAPKDADAAWQKIFSLEQSSQTDEPLAGTDKWYKVKLVKIERPTDEDWAKEKEEFTKRVQGNSERDLLRAYVQQELKNAKVKTYLE